MIRWTSFSQASSDGKTLSAFHMNFLSSLLRRGTVFGISFSISLNSRKLQTHEQLPSFHSILPSRYFPPKRLIKTCWVCLRITLGERNKSSPQNQVSGPPRYDPHELPQLREQDKVQARRPLYV